MNKQYLCNLCNKKIKLEKNNKQINSPHYKCKNCNIIFLDFLDENFDLGPSYLMIINKNNIYRYDLYQFENILNYKERKEIQNTKDLFPSISFFDKKYKINDRSSNKLIVKRNNDYVKECSKIFIKYIENIIFV